MNKRQLKKIVKKRNTRANRRPRIKLSPEAKAMKTAAEMQLLAAGINLLSAFIGRGILSDLPYPKLPSPPDEEGTIN